MPTTLNSFMNAVSSASHVPGLVLRWLDSPGQKTHHLFIVHLLDLLKVNRIPDSC